MNKVCNLKARIHQDTSNKYQQPNLSTCRLWHITAENGFCVNTQYALLKTHKK